MIGAPFTLINGYAAGRAYVFTFTGGTWSGPVELVADAAVVPARLYGIAVAISGDGTTITVGASHDAGANATGNVYVFTQSGGLWTQTGDLSTGVATAEQDSFGASVSLNETGSVALVGAPGVDIGAGVGAAFVFTLAGGVWSTPTELVGPSPADGDGFGSAVALSANGLWLTVGAPYRSVGTHPGAGAVYVYGFSGGTWTGPSVLTAAIAADNAGFGWAVAIDTGGNRAVVVSPGQRSLSPSTRRREPGAISMSKPIHHQHPPRR